MLASLTSKTLIAGGTVLVAALAGRCAFTQPPRSELGAAPATEQPAVTATALPEVAIRRSLAPLRSEGVAWLEGRTRVQTGDDGCVSCHQVPFGAWGLEHARRAGVVDEAEGRGDFIERAMAFVSRPDKARTMSWGPLALATQAEPAEILRPGGFGEFALGSQTAQGFWEAKGQFPSQRRPLDETNAVATLWTILVLSPAAGTDADVAESLARARAWIDATGKGDTTEWWLLKSLADELAGEPERARSSRLLVLQGQNPDGGWGWRRGEESNALSTGQVLYLLQLDGSPRSQMEGESLERAQLYLVETQSAEGWWHVSSALTSKEKTEDRDYVYDYWGTAWATIGLAQSRLAPSAGTDSGNHSAPAS